MFCISLGSVLYAEPSPCSAPGLLLLPFSGFQGQEIISANAIQNSHCIPALCSSTHLLPAMFAADRTTLWGTSRESIYSGLVMYFTSTAHVSYFCELLMSKCESFIWNIYGHLYTMPRGKNTSAHYFYRNKNTKKPDKTHNCISSSL